MACNACTMAEINFPVSPIRYGFRVGKIEKVFRALIAKEKVFPFICCRNFTIFASAYQASLVLLVVAQKCELSFS